MDLQLLGGIVGVVIHIPLLFAIWKGTVRQSFASYGLWSVLDIIAAYAIFAQGGNFWLPLLFGICAGLTSFSLLCKKCFQWGHMEWLVLGLVLVCVCVQYTAGNFWAMIASVAALTIASVPQFINTYQKPDETSSFVYAVFSLASFLSLLGAKSLELEQVLYSGFALLNCGIIFLLSLRKKKN